jgi:hypothetical protein
MINAFELHWRCGEPGTVSRGYLTEGHNRRPQGIPLITLLASLLDPRFKMPEVVHFLCKLLFHSPFALRLHIFVFVLRPPLVSYVPS